MGTIGGLCGDLYGDLNRVCMGSRLEVCMGICMSWGNRNSTWFHENCIHQPRSVKRNHNICIVKHLNLCWIIFHQLAVVIGVYFHVMFCKHHFLSKIQCKVSLGLSS